MGENMGLRRMGHLMRKKEYRQRKDRLDHTFY